ncbi:MAG: hypothetical protein K2K21_11450 [Lachnospiraceae bacterium]|nr:hypothetical protein [Lachnospiraceae bacterium]
MKKNKVIVSFILIFLIISGSISYGIYSCRVQFVGDNNHIGGISKDENDDVWACGYVTLYNGGWKDKKVVFEVDNENTWNHLEKCMKEEKYEVTKIEIVSGNGQVDEENMVLIIPSNETVNVRIDAHNIYIGEDYKGESIGLYREAPRISFHVIK